MQRTACSLGMQSISHARRTMQRLRRYDSLVSGGVLLLEFQEWCTYRKKRCLVPIFKENYAKIQERSHTHIITTTLQRGATATAPQHPSAWTLASLLWRTECAVKL